MTDLQENYYQEQGSSNPDKEGTVEEVKKLIKAIDDCLVLITHPENPAIAVLVALLVQKEHPEITLSDIVLMDGKTGSGLKDLTTRLIQNLTERRDGLEIALQKMK
jgi:hypothetical protein